MYYTNAIVIDVTKGYIEKIRDPEKLDIGNKNGIWTCFWKLMMF